MEDDLLFVARRTLCDLLLGRMLRRSYDRASEQLHLASDLRAEVEVLAQLTERGAVLWPARHNACGTHTAEMDE